MFDELECRLWSDICLLARQIRATVAYNTPAGACWCSVTCLGHDNFHFTNIKQFNTKTWTAAKLNVLHPPDTAQFELESETYWSMAIMYLITFSGPMLNHLRTSWTFQVRSTGHNNLHLIFRWKFAYRVILGCGSRAHLNHEITQSSLSLICSMVFDLGYFREVTLRSSVRSRSSEADYAATFSFSEWNWILTDSKWT